MLGRMASMASVGAVALVAAAPTSSSGTEYSPNAYVTSAIVSQFGGLTPGTRYQLGTETDTGYFLGDTAKTVDARGRVQWVDEIPYYFAGHGHRAEACLYPDGGLAGPPAVDAQGRELCGETTW